MKRTEESDMIDALYKAYWNAYLDNLDGAAPDYYEWFSARFAPPEKPWRGREEAASGMRRLIGEISSHRADAGAFLEESGLTDMMDRYFRLGASPRRTA